MGGNSKTRPIVRRKMINLLTRNGFTNNKGAKHGKYERSSDAHKIMVPRHKVISPGLSQQLRKELVELHGFSQKDVDKLS